MKEKFFKINVDPNTYQWIIPEGEDKLIYELTTFNCAPKLKNWINVPWYIFNPKKTKGNFFTLGNGGSFAFDQHVYNSDLFDFFERCGEIIPVQIKETKLYILNVLECVNALDEENTQRRIYPNGKLGSIEKYKFHKNRLSESSIFKIPETSKGDIFTYIGMKDEKDEFKYRYEHSGFTGLEFIDI